MAFPNFEQGKNLPDEIFNRDVSDAERIEQLEYAICFLKTAFEALMDGATLIKIEVDKENKPSTPRMEL